MSARSPRGSFSGDQNLADDFEESLQDLTQNNRLEISNLTLIAKESTEFAQDISKVLEKHIKSTAPTRKLPALYVLDSIVKNVGTPYTVYLSRGLYSTFMEAYTQVDSNTRRSMEAMLKTWKEPVPGSIDPRPVFPPDIVQPIENALMKAKMVVLQNQRTVQPLYRNTPTPPQYGNQPVPNLEYAQNRHYPQFNAQQQMMQQQQHIPQYQAQPSGSVYRQSPAVQPGNDVESIKTETALLISRMQGQFAMNPQDQNLRTKLQALLQLQDVLKVQSLEPSELQQIKSQISLLSIAPIPTPTPPPAASTQYWQPPVPLPQSNPSTQSFMPYSTPQPVVPPPSILAPGTLESLQALLANGQKPSTPQLRNAAPALQNASHAQLNTVAATPVMNSNDLIAALTKNNLLANLPNSTPAPPASNPPAAPPSHQSTASLLESLKGFLPPLTPSNTPSQTMSGRQAKIPMTAASLKEFRPELVRSLYDGQPNQCSNCGRRFLASDEGRTKKGRHLDWHFRTNQRMADSSVSRGQHRNWFVEEMEWIRLAEFDPSTTTAEDAAANAAGNKPQKRTQDSFVRAPPGMTKNTCSICYEEMKSSYAEELEDWVFTNAVMYGNPPRIVHATCAEEIKKSTHQPGSVPGLGGSLATVLAAAGNNNGRRSRSATPDSTLGKRKAESILAGLSARLKTDQ
ncbi:Hypothetical protein R9X50_00381100 [Acrodontium crateriforme]|uniref:CID domain-containing protein n=1 Tax=Acrodontium crateriforme TaxID=150365 RepID=A0AAQ3M9T4_9PEZI|nr:Hypothetical protein R9X50_00381100 [Acrodontium crateriforme]